MDAIQTLVMEHQDYVRSLARIISRKVPAHVDFEDLVGFGQVGLAEAARAFRANGGAQFVTFAYYRIRGAIFDGLRKMAGISPAVRNRLARLSGQDDVGEAAATPTVGLDDPEFLASQFAEVVRRLGAVYLVSRAADGQEMEAAGDRSAADEVEEAELLARVRQAIGTLPEREMQIVRMMYFEHLSQTDCAKRMGVDKSTICRIHREAIAMLRGALGD